jgi:prepilin-type N-terminal cleavage/methylation domain-containing protein
MKAQKTGFTLIELLVVIASVAILATLLLPALAGTRQNSQVIGCLANQKRLAAGWTMYARDNNDVLVPNRGLGGQSPQTLNPLTNPDLQPGGRFAQWCPGDVGNNITIALYYDQWIKAGLLYSYVNSLSVYHCPGDHNRVPHTVAPQIRRPALRTYSMSSWVQSIDGVGYNPMAWNGITGYINYTKLASMSRPGPSKTWVFMEESPIGMDDGYFAVDPTQTNSWYNFPSVLHGNASVLAFADGHSDSHRWTDAYMMHGIGADANGERVAADPNSQDLSWLLSATTVHK